MNQKDFSLLLALLNAHEGTIVGRKRFQKLVCILKYARDVPFSFDFIPYHYGPYSESLTSAIDRLVCVGLVEEEKCTITDHVIQYSYRLTDEGHKLASVVVQTLRQDEPELAGRLIESTEELYDSDIVNLVRQSKDAFRQTQEGEIIYQ
jgi:uncharacterized protein YwgA